jgi:hypothetical protein
VGHLQSTAPSQARGRREGMESVSLSSEPQSPTHQTSAALLAPGFLLILLTTAAGEANPPRTWRTGGAGPTHRARRGSARNGGTAEAARRRRRWSCDAEAVEGAGRSGPVLSGRWMAMGPYGPARSAVSRSPVTKWTGRIDAARRGKRCRRASGAGGPAQVGRL